MGIFSEPFTTEALDREITKQRTESITVKDIKKKKIQITQCIFRVPQRRSEVRLTKQEAVTKDRKY